MRQLIIILVAFAAVWLAAVWIGYPIWLRLRAGSRGRGKQPITQPHMGWPTVTIVAVVHNMESTVRGLLNNLLALAYPSELRRILIISDESTDFTDAVAGNFVPHGVDILRVMHAGRRSPESFARQYTNSEVVVVVDPRARLRPSALAALVGPFMDPSVGVAFGREVPAFDPFNGVRPRESFFWRYESRLRDLETRVFGTVSARGSLYAVRGPLYRAPVPAGLSADFAPILTAREHGYRAVSVRTAECVMQREPTTHREYARKVESIARDIATLAVQPRFLNPRTYGVFAYLLMGHKIGRWVTPWALLIGFVGLIALAPFEAWARTSVAVVCVIGLVTGLASLSQGRTALSRWASAPGRLITSAVAMAHAGLTGWHARSDPRYARVSRPIFRDREALVR